MGLKVVLSDVVFTDTTLPKLEKDPILNAGSLLLIDFSNPNGWKNGSTLPVNNDLVPNVAWDKAAAIIGSGTESSLSAQFLMQNLTGTSSAKHKYEFSSKKGLHGILSQSPGIATNDNFRMIAPSAVRDYMINNLPDTGSGVGHDFYISMWYKTTRINTASDGALSGYMTTTGSYVYWIPSFTAAQRGDYNGVAVTTSDYRSVTPNTAATNAIRNLHFNSFHGTKGSGSIATTPILSNFWGNMSPFGSSMSTGAPSYILYKYYIEDLTVSGRTYAQADAQDYALWQEAFGVGGRFYGDTYTSPSTLA